MTHGLRRVAFLALTLLVASAHVGSHDAWYDGPAGPYHVLVHVQAPPVVPGIAVVNVRVAGVDRVTAFVNRHDATGGTPPPDVAEPVRDNPGWYRTPLWVMTSGSHGVTVALHGRSGTGSVVVPLTAVAGRRLGFDAPLAGLLIVAGLFLAFGLVSIVGAAVRESVLPAGAEPDVRRRSRARYAMGRAVVVVALVVSGMAAWWRAADADFAEALFEPLAVTSRVDLAAAEPRLTLAIEDSAWAHRSDASWLRAHGKTQFTGLVEDHGRLVHLFLAAADARSAFAHLHPSTTDTVSFTTPLPPLPQGTYWIFADIVHASGFSQTLTSSITLPALDSTARSTNAGRDDSWLVEKRPKEPSETKASLQDGTTLTWLRGSAPLVAGAEANLRFAISTPRGDSAALEPYLGMAGHAVVLRDDGRVFIHLHPMGTISLAAQAAVSNDTLQHVRHAAVPTLAPGDTLDFPYAFPQPGTYTLWVQCKRRGRVLTASFVVQVSAEPKGR